MIQYRVCPLYPRFDPMRITYLYLYLLLIFRLHFRLIKSPLSPFLPLIHAASNVPASAFEDVCIGQRIVWSYSELA